MPDDHTTTSDVPLAVAQPDQVGPPPHLAELALTGLTAEQFDAFHRAEEHGFHEETPAEHLELDRAVFDPERFFGFTVDGRWVSTFGSFARQLTVPGGAAIPASAVTAVTVHGAYRRRGLLRRSMSEEFRRCRDRGEVVAVLFASESSIYGRFGYANAASEAWLSGSTQALRLRADVDGALRAAGGSVDEVDRGAFIPLVRDLHDRLRARRPGSLDRPEDWWQLTLSDPVAWRKGATALRFLVSYNAAGMVDGHATYSVKWGGADAAGGIGIPTGEVQIREVEAEFAVGYARLWRYLISLDLVRTFTVDRAPVGHMLQYLVAGPRAIQTRLQDALYVRILDVASALSARRYAAPIDVVLDVRDDVLPESGGRFALRGGLDSAEAVRCDLDPDMTMSARELASIYLGETSLGALHAAGLVDEHRPGTVAAASAAFGWPIAPYCADPF
ncbi:MAG: GNAT family N-acetyltransferase [Nakamurella sp.]